MTIFNFYIDPFCFNIGVCISGAVLSVILFIASFLEKIKGQQESAYMQIMTLADVLMFLSFSMVYLQLFDYAIGTIDRIFISAGAVFRLLALFSSNMYMIYRLGHKRTISAAWNYILATCYLIAAVLFCIGMIPKYDCFYTISSTYDVVPTTACLFFNAFELLCSLFNIILVIVCCKQLGKGEIASWIVVFIFPVIAFSLYLYMQIDLINIAFEIVLIVFYVAIHNRDILEKHVIESELIESNAKLMVSQIQPHFLYNSLNTIYYLVGKDQDTARKAISTFSDYLRGNVNSLKNNSPVPIEEEISHVKAYLSLEELRFGDKIKILIEENSSTFLIPPLTVQPLVENAIKHGLAVKKGGGCLMITTYEDDKNYYVQVQDDGVGFVAKKLDDRSGTSTHIGLFNVYSRLKNMCGGKLRVISEPGSGTQCIISIPK